MVRFIKHPVFWIIIAILSCMILALTYEPDFKVWGVSKFEDVVKIYISAVFVVTLGIVGYQFFRHD